MEAFNSVNTRCPSSSIRKWKLLTNHNSKAYKQFRVLTFNILSNSYVNALHPHKYPKYLHSNKRKYYIFKEIARHKPDFACLQEIDGAQYKSFYTERFNRCGYSGLYKERCEQKSDGIATFWNSERFHLLASESKSYRTTGIMDRDNVGHVLLFEESLPPQTPAASPSITSNRFLHYIVANTHLLFNPNRGDIKLGQLLMFIRMIGDMVKRSREMRGVEGCSAEYLSPVLVVCGDYNISPNSDLYNFISNGVLDFKDVDRYYSSGQQHKIKHTNTSIHTGDSHLISGRMNERSVQNEGPDKTSTPPSGTSQWISDVEKAVSTSHCKSDDVFEAKDLKFHLTPPQTSNTTYVMPFTLRSAYFVKRNEGASPTECDCTSLSQSMRRCIDYIWYNPKFVKVHAIYETPEDPFYKEFVDLPNEKWRASDHFSLIADFEIVDKPLNAVEV